jgi:hypothetical protein
MASRPARITSIVIGVIFVLTGLVWAGQGLNLIPGSSMTGNRMWFYIGLAATLVGAILIVAGTRKGRPARP